MKLIYTNENRLLVSNVKNIVEGMGVAVTLKNEFSSGAAGELSPFDVWPELWVVDDVDYEKAVRIIESAFRPENAKEWLCSRCSEKNDASFDVCWNCQNES